MIWKSGRDHLQVRNRFGWENFRDPWDAMPLSLHDFWEWGIGDFTSNAARTALAEFLVSRVLGALANGGPGAGFDFVTKSGLKINLTTAGAFAGWPADRRAAAQYCIAPTLVYDAATRQTARGWSRPSDIHVFALLQLGDKGLINPTDTNHWLFNVVSSRALDSLEHGAPVISHGTLEARCRSSPAGWRGPVLYRNLRVEVEGLGVAMTR
ncbi:MAG: hypothetical protein ABL908_13100 [Hyphomicrobium sp.]